MVIRFGFRFFGRLVMLAPSIRFHATIFQPVGSDSIMPLALTTLLLSRVVRTIVVVSWNEYENSARMPEVRTNVFVPHLAALVIIAVSPLAPLPNW